MAAPVEAVPQTLPVPIGRLVVPEVVVGARGVGRGALVRSAPRDDRGSLARGYWVDSPAPTGLLVDVYG